MLLPGNTAMPLFLLTFIFLNMFVVASGQDSDADSGEPELCFNPVSLGQAVEMLPSYLRYEIKFGASQRQILVGRIMEALGRCKTIHRNVEG